MNTKAFSAKKLLSLMLVITMMITMVLPTNVFAAFSAATNGTISNDIETVTLVVGETAEFTVSTKANDDAGVKVIGRYEIDSDTAISKLEYSKDGNWITLDKTNAGDFGDPAGFEFEDAKYNFRVTFAEKGIYKFKVSIVTFDGTYGVKLCEETDEIKVVELADFTELNEAIANATATNTDNCTADSINAFNTALAAAKNIDQNATTEDEQDDVDAATDALKDAIAGLTALADFTAYDGAIADVNALVRSNYTKGTIDALDTVVAANVIDKSNEADQTKVDNATNAITTAIANLVETRVVEFTAVAVASDVTANYAKADEIYLVFSEAIQGSPNLISDLKVDGESASGYLADAGWVDNTIYRIDIIGDIDNDVTIEFVGNDNILAVAGHALKGYSTTIVGNLDEAYENVTATAMTATIVNVDDKPYMVDGDEIVLVFNAPVYGNPNTIIAEGMTFAVVANTSNTVYKKVLDADADTVTVGMPLTFDDGTGRTAITTTLKGTFGGTVVPVVVRALVEDVDGTAKTAGDKINVFFNAPTNKVAGTVENTFTGVLAGATGRWIDNQTLVITLGNTAITVNNKIDLTNLGIKDFYGIEDADADEIELEGSFGTAIQPALLTLTAISKQGKGAPSAGDEIYLAFNVKMREDALNLQNDFDFNYGDYGTGASVAWATGSEYAEYSTIIITLGEGANVVPGTTKITIEKELFEESGIKSCEVSNLENRIVTGTFGTSIAPSLISASIVKRSTVVGSQAGDQIVLLFNVPTNAADIINLISVAGGDLGNNVEEGVWSNNNTIYTITLGDGTAIANDTSITFTNTNGVLKDINNQKVASTKTLELNGSFGVEADEVGISPSSVTATIVKTTADAGAQAGDKIVFAFNVATNGVDLVNYFKSKGIYGNAGLTGGWSNGNTVYTLVLGDGATVTDTNVAEFTVEAGIKDKNEINGAVTLTAGAFIGSFGATITPVAVAPSVIGATIIKGEGNTEGKAQKGDIIKIAFNMATNKVDLFNNLGGVNLFGDNGASGEWNEDGNIYIITLGEGATITDDTILKITDAVGLKDAQEYSGSAKDDNIKLVGSFGETITPVGVAPSVIGATIIKGEGNTEGKAQKGDIIKIAFNMATNKVDLFNNLGGVNLFGDNGASGEWNEDGNIYIITLGEGATITDDTILKITDAVGLKDAQEYSGSAKDDNIKLIGTFGETVTPVAPVPELLRVDIIKKVPGENEVAAMGAQKGDILRFIFNIKTNKVDKLIDKIQQTLNNNIIAAFGADASGDWNEDGNIYEIILGKNPTMTENVRLVIPESAGIKDEKSVSASKSYTVDKFYGTFGESVVPVALSAVAFSEEDKDYINVIFNVAVNCPDGDVMIFNNEYNENGKLLGDEPEGKWMSDNIYRITLGNGYTVKNTSVLHFNDAYKIYSKDGNAEMGSGSSVTITGELRKPMVTEVYAGTKVVNGDDVTYEAADTITVVFSSKTNGEEVDLSAQSSSLGTNATAEWNATKTELKITLGGNYTISVNGTGGIILNGLGITNGFDTNEVVGQYTISAGILPVNNLKVVDARVNKRDDGNYLTVTFNAPTNMYGKVLGVPFNVSEDKENIVATKAFGTGATAVWESASRLEITLGEGHTFKNANDTKVAADSKVTFKNLKFANGLGTIVEEAFTITGSFDGRETRLEELKVETKGEFTTVGVTLNKQELDFGKSAKDKFAIVTFVIWNKEGKLVTDMNAIKIEMNAVDKIELQSKFAASEVGKVDVYVTDAYINEISASAPAFKLYADTVTKTLETTSTSKAKK